jgi:hypothetical protein
MTKHYMCGVDLQHEYEEGQAQFFDSIEDLKEKKKCWPQCGIVEVYLDSYGHIVVHEWVVKQDFSVEIK